MKFQLLLAFITESIAQVALPSICATQCTTLTFAVLGCSASHLSNWPQYSNSQWINIGTQVSNCLCPAIISDSDCQNCLVQNLMQTKSQRFLAVMKTSCTTHQIPDVTSQLLGIWGFSLLQTSTSANFLEANSTDVYVNGTKSNDGTMAAIDLTILSAIIASFIL